MHTFSSAIYNFCPPNFWISWVSSRITFCLLSLIFLFVVAVFSPAWWPQFLFIKGQAWGSVWELCEGRGSLSIGKQAGSQFLEEWIPKQG